ncbi:MAG: hypothetical protein E8D52_13900 [Nitrospira sp.]|nr:MAG: hypothetical protein E8D52_13900 [Nitrospira sp.]
MTKKHIVVALFLLSIVFLSITPQGTHAALINADLTAGTWLVKGIDNGGNRWDGSTLVFEQQTVQGQDFSLSGYFNWVGSGGQFGRENFTGTLFSNQDLKLSGFEIVHPSIGLGLANYFATLAGSGTEIVNGSWSGTAITASNNWSATLAPVPLPAAILLFVPGLVGIGVLANRKRS